MEAGFDFEGGTERGSAFAPWNARAKRGSSAARPWRPPLGTRKAEGLRAGRTRPEKSNPTSIRLSGPIEHDSIVNGPGLRAVIWTQGCPNHCEGCQNPETWDFNGGVLIDIEEVKEELKKLKGQTGLTFCGGEPFVQPAACLELAKFAHKELGWDVWSFSGFTYEEIKAYGEAKTDDEAQSAKNRATLDFLNELDALIDGRFVLAERDLTLKFRGSRNQRILHLKNGQITSIEQ